MRTISPDEFPITKFHADIESFHGALKEALDVDNFSLRPLD